MKIEFCGAAKTVTGSRTRITYNNKTYLIDCGLFQGPKEIRQRNWDFFEGADKLSAVLLTHAHIDHSGYLPKLVKEGFRGPIFCSEATRELCQIMLMDSAHLQEEDARFFNKRGGSKHQPALPLYNEQDALQCLRQFRSRPMHDWHQLDDGLSFRFLRAGHILGSSFIQISYLENGQTKILTMSGDLGNGRQYVIKAPEAAIESDFLVLESTYGDRVQERADPMVPMAELINRVYNKKGVLVIPAFSVGRTQEMLYLMRNLETSGRIPKIDVYLDSPMAIEATEIYLKYPAELKYLESENGFELPLCPSCYHVVRSADESMLLCMRDGPFVVISAAGMLTGGRILHHLKSRLPHAENAVLFVGYQADQTKGKLLQGGLPVIRIHHEKIHVEAEIKSIESLSAHADSNDLMAWVEGFQRPPKKIFLNHGEEPALRALAYRLRTELEIETVIPEVGEQFEI